MLQLVFCLACAASAAMGRSRHVSCLVVKDEKFILALVVPAGTQFAAVGSHRFGPLSTSF